MFQLYIYYPDWPQSYTYELSLFTYHTKQAQAIWKDNQLNWKIKHFRQIWQQDLELCLEVFDYGDDHRLLIKYIASYMKQKSKL